MSNIAEWTPPGAQITHNHESGCSVSEAFTQIRAIRLLTYCMQLVFSKNLFKFRDFWCSRKWCPNPGGFPQPFISLSLRYLNWNPRDLINIALTIGGSVVTHAASAR